MESRRHVFNQKGFTLIELLIVITIIVMLAGIGGPRLWKALSKGKHATTKQQIEELGQAIDLFRIDTHRFPTTQEGLKSLITNPGVEGWDGSYLKKSTIPKDPWNREYHYQSPGTHGEFDIYSFGKDGSQGGEGEDKDITSWE